MENFENLNIASGDEILLFSLDDRVRVNIKT